MYFLLLDGRYYEAEICTILFPLRCSLKWYHFLPKSNLTFFGRKLWTIVRGFDQTHLPTLLNCAHMMSSHLSQDIAVLTDNTSLCDMYQTESFNVQPRQHCRHLDSNDEPQWFSTYNNEEDCVANDGGTSVR